MYGKFLVFLLFAGVDLKALDSQVICKLNAETLSDCVKTAIEEKFRQEHDPNSNAISDSLDPYFFENGEVVLKKSKRAKGEFGIYNTTIVGAKSLELKGLAITEDHIKKTINVSGHFFLPLATVDGFYKSNVTIGELSFVSIGDFQGFLEGANGKFTISGFLEEIEDGSGLKKFRATDFNLILLINNMKFNLTGLTRDENINKVFNQLINDGWRPVYQEAIKFTKPIWSPLAVQVFNEKFNFISFEE